MRIDDLNRFHTPARPSLHPDGVRVAFDVTTLDMDDDRNHRSVWIHDGSSARRFTGGTGDASPKWSPSGDRLAFLRTDPAPKPVAQVAVMQADGGEADVVTDLPLGVTDFSWHPDGTRLAVVGTTWTDEWAELDDDERARKPRHIAGIPYRSDNKGWVHDRRSQVWIVDLETGERSRAGDRDAAESSPAWSPDGSRLAFLALPDDPRGMEPGVDVIELDMAGGERTVVHATGDWSRLAYDPEGTLHAVGDERHDSYPCISSLWRLVAEGPTDLTGHIDRSIWSFLLSPEMAEPVWLDDGFLIGLEDSGRVGVIAMRDGVVDEVVSGERFVKDFCGSLDRLVFVASDPIDPGELFELVDGQERALTDLNGEFRRSVPLASPTHRRVATDDGVEVDVWTYLPDGDGLVPVLLNIHGGPASQYGFTFFDEFQVYAGAGYGVVACNPRGSSGRGNEFVRGVTGDGWGVVDQHDVLTVLESELAREPRLDGERMGIMGGSYGGFLTAWITSTDHRFCSAVVERALLSWETFAGTSDIARDFPADYLGAAPPTGHARLREASPLTLAHQITTPTLIVHSENDFRCPIEQAEQLFMLLLRVGTDVEFLRFPGESHELSRSGKPRHRAERFESILAWHARHLLDLRIGAPAASTEQRAKST